MTEKGDSVPWIGAGMVLLLVGAGMILYRDAVSSSPCTPPSGCGAVRGGPPFWVAVLLMVMGIPFLIQAYRVYSRSG